MADFDKQSIKVSDGCSTRQKVKMEKKKDQAIQTCGTPPQRCLIYRKGEYLAIRNEIDKFWLCEALQNVYTTSKEIHIRWLDKRKDNDYVYHSYDKISIECIITNVQMKRKVIFRIDDAEKVLIRSVLRKSINQPQN